MTHPYRRQRVDAFFPSHPLRRTAPCPSHRARDERGAMWSRIMCSHSSCSPVNFSPAPLWRFIDPVLEVTPYRIGIGREFRVDATDAADERHERGQFVARVRSLVFIQQSVGPPYPQRRELRAVGLERIENGLNHRVGHLRAARRLAVEDGQRLDLVSVLFQVCRENPSPSASAFSFASPLHPAARTVSRLS